MNAKTPGWVARAMPAQTITVAGPPEPAFATVAVELNADGWQERVRIEPFGALFETGSAAKAFWLGSMLDEVVPLELVAKRTRRSVEFAQAVVHAQQAGEHTLVEVAIVWRETETITNNLQNEFRAAIDRAIGRFQAAGVLLEVSPLTSAYTLPKEHFCSPANRRRYVKEAKRREAATRDAR